MNLLIVRSSGLALPIAAALVFSSIGFATPPRDTILAKLGSTSIREADFQFYQQGMFAPEERTMLTTNAAARAEALEAYLDLRVISAKARRDGLDRTVTFQKASELMQMKWLARMLTERERERFTKAGAVTDQEVRAYYDQHPEQFRVTPVFTMRQIIIYVKGNPSFPEKGHTATEAATLAEKALARLRAGESWTVVAKECSEDSASGARGGLMENAQFGYFPPELEVAVRHQEIGKLGDVVKTDFGYHVLLVEKRTSDGERQSFATVQDVIKQQIANEKLAVAHRAYLDPIRAAVKLQETPLAAKDTFVLNPANIKTNDVLATLDGKPIYQADFEWFARDAFRMEQREQVFSRPGARIGMVKTYLNMRALEAHARQLGLDKTPDYQAVISVEEMKLLGEFLQERDKTTPWLLAGKTPDEQTAALQKYLNGLRTEVGLQVVSQ